MSADEEAMKAAQSSPSKSPSGRASPAPPSGRASPALPSRVKVKSQSPSAIPNSPGLKSPHKSPKRSPKIGVGTPKIPHWLDPNLLLPVTPTSPKDMMGAQTSMDTGITYPVNVWGPISKYGYLDEIPPRWTQKKHFEGKHIVGESFTIKPRKLQGLKLCHRLCIECCLPWKDKLMKKRLVARRFSHIRHPAYKELIEPEEHQSSLYLNPKRKEFWRTDVERVMKREEDKRKARYRELVEIWANEKAWRLHEVKADRDDRCQAFLELDKNLKEDPGFRNNKSGAAYDIFTLKCNDGYEGQKILFKEELSRYKQIARALFLQERMSGARLYNVINWLKMPPCRTLPPFPKEPGPPPPPLRDPDMIPLNASKGALSFAYTYGPFGTIP